MTCSAAGGAPQDQFRRSRPQPLLAAECLYTPESVLNPTVKHTKDSESFDTETKVLILIPALKTQSQHHHIQTLSYRGSWTGFWQSFYFFPCSDPSGYSQAPAASSLFCDWSLNCFLLHQVSCELSNASNSLASVLPANSQGLWWTLSDPPSCSACARQHILFLRTYTLFPARSKRSLEELAHPLNYPNVCFLLLSIFLSLCIMCSSFKGGLGILIFPPRFIVKNL